jgi:5-methylcytosine-specific restriction endonuclease McrA
MTRECLVSIFGQDGVVVDRVTRGKLNSLLAAQVVILRKSRAIVRAGASLKTTGDEIKTSARIRPLRANGWNGPAIAASVSRGQVERYRRQVSAPGSHTPEEWAELIQKYGNRCLRCSASGEEVQLTRDHIVPLFGGGTNNIGNLQPLCRRCNSWKGAQDIDFRPAEKPLDS